MARVLPSEIILLELTRREAETLARVTASIGGSAKLSRRGDTDRIGQALLDVGFSDEHGPEQAGSIFFDNDI